MGLVVAKATLELASRLIVYLTRDQIAVYEIR